MAAPTRRRALVIAGLLALPWLAGCASSGDIDRLSSQIDALQTTAQDALQASQAAEAQAARNQAELDALRRESAATRELAEQANQRVDQVFETGQMK